MKKTKQNPFDKERFFLLLNIAIIAWGGALVCVEEDEQMRELEGLAKQLREMLAEE